MLDSAATADPLAVAGPSALPAVADAPAWRELTVQFSGNGLEVLRIWLLHLRGCASSER